MLLLEDWCRWLLIWCTHCHYRVDDNQRPDPSPVNKALSAATGRNEWSGREEKRRVCLLYRSAPYRSNLLCLLFSSNNNMCLEKVFTVTFTWMCTHTHTHTHTHADAYCTIHTCSIKGRINVLILLHDELVTL